jgi:hypothetical protein
LRGQPLINYETIVNLINKTYTNEVLIVKCRLDHRKYELGIKVTDEEIEALNKKKEKFMVSGTIHLTQTYKFYL